MLNEQKNFFWYVTSVSLFSTKAMSIQVCDMVLSFKQESLFDFTLISPSFRNRKQKKKLFKWIQIKLWTKSNLIRQFLFVIQVFFLFLFKIRELPKLIYTRNIVITWVCFFFNIYCICEIHNDSKNWINSFLFKTILFYKKLFFVFTNQALLDFYVGFYKEVTDRSFCSHAGVFIENYDKKRNIPKKELKKKLKIPQKYFLMVHTGNLAKLKGSDYFGLLLKNFPNIMVVHLGGTKDEIAVYKRDALKGLDQKRISFLSHQGRETVINYQMAADVLLFLLSKKTTDYYWCTSPIKLGEYMATGNVIVGAKIGSVVEILNDQNAFLYLEDEEGKNFVEAVKKALTNKVLGKKLAKKALEEVRENRTYQKRASNILKWASTKTQLDLV